MFMNTESDTLLKDLNLNVELVNSLMLLIISLMETKYNHLVPK